MPFLFVCFGWGMFVYFLLKCVVAMTFIFTISKFSISISDATLYWLL